MTEVLRTTGKELTIEEYQERQIKLAQHLILALAVTGVTRDRWVTEWCQSQRGLSRDDMNIARSRLDDDNRFDWKILGGHYPVAGALPGSPEEYDMINYVAKVRDSFEQLKQCTEPYDEIIPGSTLRTSLL